MSKLSLPLQSNAIKMESKTTRPKKVIRSIIIGDLKDGFRITVGRPFSLGKDESGKDRKGTITHIIDRYNDIDGKHWEIYIRESEQEPFKLWKVHYKGNISVHEELDLNY